MFTDNESTSSSFDLTSVIDTAIGAAGSAYAASQATSAPTYLPGQNPLAARVALGSSGMTTSPLILLVVGFVAVFAIVTFARK